MGHTVTIHFGLLWLGWQWLKKQCLNNFIGKTKGLKKTKKKQKRLTVEGKMTPWLAINLFSI